MLLLCASIFKCRLNPGTKVLYFVSRCSCTVSYSQSQYILILASCSLVPMMVNAVLSSFSLSLSDSTLSLMSARDSKLIRLSCYNKVQGVFTNVT